MKSSPVISVILCTYNRAEQLPRALDSLLAQSLDKSVYDIIIVNNASTDRTSDIIKEYQAAHASPPIVLVTETRQGLGYARNSGCKHAQGRYVAFIDDDCIAAKDWLETLLNCYEHIHPAPWSVGGRIVPIYDEAKPAWFKDRFETDSWGDAPRFLKRGESFTGCNMSFQNDVVERFGAFDAKLDMKGDSLSLAGETDLYRRIWSKEKQDAIFYYAPRAVVHHIIHPYKMTVSYQLKRAFSAGQASWAMAQAEPMTRLCRLVIGSIALLLWYSLKAVLHIRPGHWQSWAVEQLYTPAYNIGRLSGFFGVRIAFRQRSTSHGCG